MISFKSIFVKKVDIVLPKKILFYTKVMPFKIQRLYEVNCHQNITVQNTYKL